MSAANEVFSICELREIIILFCDASSLVAMSGVGRALYQLCRTDNMLKHLVCSNFFSQTVTRYNPKHCGGDWSKNALAFPYSSPDDDDHDGGTISVLKLKDREVIVTERYHDDDLKFATVLLKGDEEIPGMTSADLMVLRGG